MKRKFYSKLFIFLAIPTFFFSCNSDKNSGIDVDLTKLHNQLACGWNTWNTRSVLSHVLLPECYSVNLQIFNGITGEFLEESLIGRRGEGVEIVKPGAHADDGSYTELSVEWKNAEFKVESASEGNNLFIAVTPVKSADQYNIVIKPQILWNKPGKISVDSAMISFRSSSDLVNLFIQGNILKWDTGHIYCKSEDKIYLSSVTSKSKSEIESIILKARINQQIRKAQYGKDSSLYDAMQTVLAWDVIYEPVNDRVISPVSRIWNCNWSGWVLFDWDTYFASLMYSSYNKNLAYANALAITNEISKNGFIPNFSSGDGKSEDRSQPPVGSYVIKEIYKKYGERWFLNAVYEKLLSWNRWWGKNRDVNGYLCWGTNPYEEKTMPDWLKKQIGKKQAAKWESGLDNSPMYQQASFDSSSHVMMLADVGLLSMYIWDCQNLLELAHELKDYKTIDELEKRIEKYSSSLKTLWNEEYGLFLNKDLITGEFSYSMSPTNFYPLLTKVPDQNQANKMITIHLLNPKEFYGNWILPSIARNDSLYKDNEYWRGRIWPPMNFLVFLGLKNYNFPDFTRELKEKSASLILKSWNEERHVYENYNAETGTGGDVLHSDKFYHWGGLLGYISIMEDSFTKSEKNTKK